MKVGNCLLILWDRKKGHFHTPQTTFDLKLQTRLFIVCSLLLNYDRDNTMYSEKWFCFYNTKIVIKVSWPPFTPFCYHQNVMHETNSFPYEWIKYIFLSSLPMHWNKTWNMLRCQTNFQWICYLSRTKTSETMVCKTEHYYLPNEY
jgi:hypothetical protein